MGLVFVIRFAIPSACAANLVRFLVSKRLGLRLLGWAVVVVVGTFCTIGFPIYMGAFAPAIAWQGARLLPLATFMAATALWIARQPNAMKHSVA